MRVAHVSQTPVAGAAWAMSEAFREAGHESICVAGSVYGDGRRMPRDEDWPPDERGVRMIQDADVRFAHQGKPYRMPWWPSDKATIGIYHSQPTPNHTDRRLERDGWPAAAIGQWEHRLYDGIPPVPNLVPLKHPWFQPGAKPGHVVIAYSPSNRTLSGWDNKGYGDTIHVLQGLHRDLTQTVEVDIIEGVPLEECLARKRRAHIVVDEVVTGAYHRSSLEALALGCVVVNHCDGICWGLIRDMTGGHVPPFVASGIAQLRHVLGMLVRLGPEGLARRGSANRAWMEAAWNPADLIRRNFEPLMDAARENAWTRAT